MLLKLLLCHVEYIVLQNHIVLSILEACFWLNTDCSSFVWTSLPLQCALVGFFCMVLHCSLGLCSAVVKGPLRLSQVLLNKTFSG